MRQSGWILAVLFASLLGVSAHAQEEEEEKRLSDVAELSFVDTGGNTDNKNLVLVNTLKYRPGGSWQITWGGKVFFAETDEERTGENYRTDLRLDYEFTQRAYSFGLAAWMRDRFAELNNRYYTGLGAGYRILTGPKHKWLAEAGVNYTLEEFTDKTDEGFPSARTFTQYSYSFTKKNVFSVWAEYLPDLQDSTNYNVNAEAALISALNGFLSLKGSYLFQFDNNPAPGATETDTIISLTLVLNLV